MANGTNDDNKTPDRPPGTADDGLLPTESQARRLRSTRLGEQLKALYDDVANEGVPADFLQLLEDADNGAKAAAGAQSSRPPRDEGGCD